MTRLIFLAMLGLLLSASAVRAQFPELGEPPEPETPSTMQSVKTEPQIGPTLPNDATWAGALVIVICGMFLAAALVGPVAKANAPEEPPPSHSHDEPPGTSHHHGHNGTKNPEPGHGDAHGAHH